MEQEWPTQKQVVQRIVKTFDCAVHTELGSQIDTTKYKSSIWPVPVYCYSIDIVFHLLALKLFIRNSSTES